MPRTITPISVDTLEDTFTHFLSEPGFVPVEPEDTVPVTATAAPEPEPEEEPEDHVHDHRHVDYEVDQAKIDAAGADPAPWAEEFVRFLGMTTNQWVDAGTISGWFSAYGARVQQFTYRQAAFAVANTTLPAEVQGDAAFLLLQLRQDITQTFKSKAGL